MPNAQFPISNAQCPMPNVPLPKLLSENWQQWIASHKLQNFPDGEIVHAMVAEGIDIRIALEEVRAILSNPFYQAASAVVNSEQEKAQALQRQLQAMESQLEEKNSQVQSLELQLNFYSKLEELEPNYGKIERQGRLSREDFLEKYYAKNTPVILTDLISDWPALSLWTPEHLKQKYGHVLVNIQVGRESNSLYEEEKERHNKIIPLGDYVDMVLSGGETNDYYMVPFNGNIYKKELHGLFEDIKMFPEYLGSIEPAKFSFWFGPAGTITPVHFDLINTFLAQVYGRKRVRLVSPNQTHLLYSYKTWFSPIDLEKPDCDRYPRFENVKILETILEPGEVLFLPATWWHQVKALDISISFSLMNFIFANNYTSLLEPGYR